MVGTDKSAQLYLRSAFKGFKLMLLESIFFNFWLSARHCFTPKHPAREQVAPLHSAVRGTEAAIKQEEQTVAEELGCSSRSELLRSRPRDGSELLP